MYYLIYSIILKKYKKKKGKKKFIANSIKDYFKMLVYVKYMKN